MNDNKKLIEDNSNLIRETKILKEKFEVEEQKVIELYEDATVVREEI